MSEKYKNKYRIPSARLQNWDYGSNAMYFITICTQRREHYFGEVENGVMILSDMGRIVQKEWEKTPEIRADMNLNLGEFVVMPNHFHAIIIIGENEFNRNRRFNWGNRRDAMHRVSTNHGSNEILQIHNFGPQSKNLASIIRGFKSAVTVSVRKTHPDFTWQTRFHDHIIRSHESYLQKSEYIKSNPSKWDEDEFFT